MTHMQRTIARARNLKVGERFTIAEDAQGRPRFLLERRCEGFYVVDGYDPESSGPIDLALESPGNWVVDFLENLDPEELKTTAIPLFLYY
jgi:hypothetical protein